MATSQYRHYIPQFLLRNFAHDRVPGNKKEQRPQSQTRLYENDKILNAVDLSKTAPDLVETPVKRTFEGTASYTDATALTNEERQRVETALDQLENSAAPIFKKIKDAQDAKAADISLSPAQNGVLLKFTLVMKYRNTLFFDRYKHECLEDYDAEDRDEFLEYCHTRGIERQLDVWLDSFVKIINADIVPGGDWYSSLAASIYPCQPWGLPHGPVLFAPGYTACLLSRTSPLGLVRAPFST
jgi:hypothetical protein